MTPKGEAENTSLLSQLNAVNTNTSATIETVAEFNEFNVWTTTPGNSQEFSYYTSIVDNNPSGNTNVATIVYKRGTTVVVTQTFIYDAADNVTSITAS